MTKFEKFLSGLAVLTLIIVGCVYVLGQDKTPNVDRVKGVNIGNDYHATTSAAIWANVPHMIASSTNGIPDIQTLGTIIIGTTDATIVQVWDATSSTDVASTSIAVIAASPAIGSTFTFDVAIARGLMINTTASFSAGRYTITYR